MTSASRVYTGPRVQGTHPVLVSFETYSDRSVEELWRASYKIRYVFADRSYLPITWPEPKATLRLQIKEGHDSDIIKADFTALA